MHRLALLAALFVLAAGPLRADDSSLQEAKAHAARAKVHYDLGEYRQAAEEYILVYRIKPLPALLYNIAQSYRQGGQYEKAKQFYKSYLRETQDPKNRAVIEKAIREIDELLAKEKKAKDGPPTGVAQERGLAAPTTAAAPPLPSPTPAPPSATATPPSSTQSASAKPPAPAPSAQPAVAASPPAVQGASTREPGKPPGTPLATLPRSTAPVSATTSAAP